MGVAEPEGAGGLVARGIGVETAEESGRGEVGQPGGELASDAGGGGEEGGRGQAGGGQQAGGEGVDRALAQQV